MHVQFQPRHVQVSRSCIKTHNKSAPSPVTQCQLLPSLISVKLTCPLALELLRLFHRLSHLLPMALRSTSSMPRRIPGSNARKSSQKECQYPLFLVKSAFRASRFSSNGFPTVGCFSTIPLSFITSTRIGTPMLQAWIPESTSQLEHFYNLSLRCTFSQGSFDMSLDPRDVKMCRSTVHRH